MPESQERKCRKAEDTAGVSHQCEAGSNRSGQQFQCCGGALLTEAADQNGNGEKQACAGEELWPGINAVVEQKTRCEEKCESLSRSSRAGSERNQQAPYTANPQALKAGCEKLIMQPVAACNPKGTLQQENAAL